jgi:hypothetical protein
MVQSHDPGGKLTLFDVLALTAAGGGAAVGFLGGQERWGPLGGLPLGLVGLFMGALAGQIPLAIAFHIYERRLRAADTATLKARFESDDVESHLLVGPLLSRGASRVELQDVILARLVSESVDKRWAAWRALNLCFPETAEGLKNIDPRSNPEGYRAKLQALRNELGGLPEGAEGSPTGGG